MKVLIAIFFHDSHQLSKTSRRTGKHLTSPKKEERAMARPKLVQFNMIERIFLRYELVFIRDKHLYAFISKVQK